jgi:hypothetical protein
METRRNNRFLGTSAADHACLGMHYELAREVFAAEWELRLNSGEVKPDAFLQLAVSLARLIEVGSRAGKERRAPARNRATSRGDVGYNVAKRAIARRSPHS